MANLYFINTKTICHPDDSWVREFNKEYKCPGCNYIDPVLREKGVDVYVRKRPDIAAVNAVLPPGINIARRDFFELFADEVAKYLKLGRVLLADGTVVDDFVTFVGKKQLAIRGSEGSSTWQSLCQCCGHYRYAPRYPWYVLRGSFFLQPIYATARKCGLVVTEELRKRIEKGRWKGIYICPLPIVDEPRDGIDVPDELLT